MYMRACMCVYECVYMRACIVYLYTRMPDPLLQKGKGLMNCVYKLCPATLYGAVHSRCSILSHDPLHHCLSGKQ